MTNVASRISAYQHMYMFEVGGGGIKYDWIEELLFGETFSGS